MKNLTIIGLGKWGETLVKSVQNKSKFVRFSSVISRNPKKIIKISKKYNLKAFNDLSTALKSSIIDGIVLCTPHSTHEKTIKKLVKFNKPIFVEKPLALNSKSAKNIIKICNLYRIKLAVGHNRRFLSTYKYLKKIIENKKIGQITHLEGTFSGKSSFKGEKKSWRNKITETPLGGMTGKGIHITDLMINLNGKVKNVLARSKNILKDSDLDDSTDLIFEFKNGVMGYVSTILATSKFWELKVYGSDGIVRIINEKDLFLKFGNKKEKQIKLKYENIEKAELEAFAKSIKSKKEFPVRLSEVFENTKLFEGALISKKLNSKLININ